ncbi:MAG: cation diffusion facilitator family transporter [Armatimonadota bacterium]|nr:cation diffusion facilitator family transporter [Armatimonadota bacterium]MDR7437979.1 cation diffusion facilitator family transporter [Armatimonadota bacterium]MDR7473061.1 cation diffusion facilitator family transporter [Armatimonadota bacterium]MDR7508096.1 cation diffusion facilitator family transporter [Armatimonadota bacterium]MDR7509398.1 cation diffusion facilitator family transporter [Armatimonadota bacterium]
MSHAHGSHGHRHELAAGRTAHGHTHDHVHGAVDPTILTTARGIWAVKWSFVGLLATAALQVVVVWLSGSVALLADTIHNFADAATAIPLGIAFLLARLRPTRRFPFGFGRVEDLAGVVIVLIIFFSAVMAAYEAVDRLLHPRPVEYLGAVIAASIIGFVGNEGVAIFRIRVGKEIGSAALVADGYHARVDGWTSLAVLVGAVGVWLGYPLADPLVGLGITAAILVIVWQSGKAVFTRLLDGVEPEVIETLAHAAGHVPGVQAVTDVRARWVGHHLEAELNVAVPGTCTVAEGHRIAKEVHHRILHHVPYLRRATIHVDPSDEVGEGYHRATAHTHDGLPAHSH